MNIFIIISFLFLFANLIKAQDFDPEEINKAVQLSLLEEKDRVQNVRKESEIYGDGSSQLTIGTLLKNGDFRHKLTKFIIDFRAQHLNDSGFAEIDKIKTEWEELLNKQSDNLLPDECIFIESQINQNEDLLKIYQPPTVDLIINKIAQQFSYHAPNTHKVFSLSHEEALRAYKKIIELDD